MVRLISGLWVGLLLVPGGLANAADSDAGASTRESKKILKGIEFFETKIRPVLVQHCYECHSAKSDEVEGGLRLDTREGIRRGGESGHAVVPGSLDESLLVEAIRHESFEMPPDAKLPDTVIADFIRWIEIGAPDPRDGEAAPASYRIDLEQGREFWAFQPPRAVPLPRVADVDWPRSDIDAFVLARLEAEGLRPVADADRTALIRRVTFDVIGLPPTPEEVEAFLADRSSDALAKVVDRLLASPHFGERWGRHWLDVARYAESCGKEFNVVYPYAWRYRDYVIAAFNKDKPFDRFIQEQVAGDLLPAQSETESDENRIATGFLTLGPKSLNERNAEQFRMDYIDDQIEVTCRAFMALTVNCARCHDHKFDPIPTTDYYAVAGIFRSTDTRSGVASRARRDLNSAKHFISLGPNDDLLNQAREEHKQQLASLEKQLRQAQKQLRNTRQVQTGDEAKPKKKITQLLDAAPQSPSDVKKSQSNVKRVLVPAGEQAAKKRPQRIIVQTPLVDKKKLLLRQRITAKAADTAAGSSAPAGNAEDKSAALKESVRRLEEEIATLEQAAPPGPELAMGVQESGEAENCRVCIRGDIESLGDEVPRGFVSVLSHGPNKIAVDESGRAPFARWLSSEENPLTARVMVNRVWYHLFGAGIVRTMDNFGEMGARPSHPELLDYLSLQFVRQGWSVKRLIRQIVLSRTYQLGSGHDADDYQLDPDNRLLWRMSRRRLDAESIRDAILHVSGQLDTTPPAGSDVAQAGTTRLFEARKSNVLSSNAKKRSVYLPLIRGFVPEMLGIFDVADPSLVVGRREVTTSPTQALYMLNSPFVMEQAEHMALRISKNAAVDPTAGIDLAYRLTLARRPSSDEQSRAIDYLSSYAKAAPATISDRELAAWSSFCQALFASAEFRYSY